MGAKVVGKGYGFIPGGYKVVKTPGAGALPEQSNDAAQAGERPPDGGLRQRPKGSRKTLVGNE